MTAQMAVLHGLARCVVQTGAEGGLQLVGMADFEHGEARRAACGGSGGGIFNHQRRACPQSFRGQQVGLGGWFVAGDAVAATMVEK